MIIDGAIARAFNYTNNRPTYEDVVSAFSGDKRYDVIDELERSGDIFIANSLTPRILSVETIRQEFLLYSVDKGLYDKLKAGGYNVTAVSKEFKLSRLPKINIDKPGNKWLIYFMLMDTKKLGDMLTIDISADKTTSLSNALDDKDHILYVSQWLVKSVDEVIKMYLEV